MPHIWTYVSAYELLQVSRELMYSVTLKKYSEIRIHKTKSYHLQFYTQMKYNLADQLSTGK